MAQTDVLITESGYENILIGLLKELGYEYTHGSEVPRSSPLYQDVYITEDFLTTVGRINAELPRVAIETALTQLQDLSGGSVVDLNMTFTTYIQDGVPVRYFVDDEEVYNRVQLLDYHNAKNNFFRVVNQYTFQERETKRPDVILFVNGMPLVLFELKSPTRDNTDTSEAYAQIQRYLKVIPSIFVPNAFCVLTDLADTRVGSITAPEDRFMVWKTKDGKTEDSGCGRIGTMIRGMCAKERLLDLVKNFICFDSRQKGKAKIIAGYHQYYAVKKAIERALVAVGSNADVPESQRKKIGVFWHTQGSGKSLSMVFFAHAIIEKLKTSTIVVITDRNQLDDQLFGQFAACKEFLHQEPVQARNKRHLLELLNNRKVNGIIFTTMQKFGELKDTYEKFAKDDEGAQWDGVLSLRRNIIVMTDEAHRGQYELEERIEEDGTTRMGFAGWIRHALPNASFIGFTGTPISSKDKNTVEVFGDYIDIYDITQAVEDGATRPVYYESRVAKLQLDQKALDEVDKLYEQFASQNSVMPTRVEQSKRNQAALDALLGRPSVIEHLCTDIVWHYETSRSSLPAFKAMIVAYSRNMAVKIYQKLLDLKPEWKGSLAVVMTVDNKDPSEWVDIAGNADERKELSKRFKDTNDPLRIVIVCDMWLTGTDIPCLGTMYLFKPMQGHNLMQAITRVNRVFPGKVGGLIVDYIGIGGALKRAMADYTNRDRQNTQNMDAGKSAYPEFQNKLSVIRDFFHPSPKLTKDSIVAMVGSGKKFELSELALDATDILVDPLKKPTFREDFIKQVRLMERLQSLCKSYATKAEQHEAAFYSLVRSLTSKRVNGGPASTGVQTTSNISALTAQIATILDVGVTSTGVEAIISPNANGETVQDVSIFDEQFVNGLKKLKQKNVAMELLTRILQQKISDYKRTSIVQSKKFSEMMQNTASRYRNGMLTSQEVIVAMIELAKQIMAEDAEAKKLGLNEEEMAFYRALTLPDAVKDAYSNEQLCALTRELTDTLRKNRTFDWQKKESARADMRRIIKRLLRKYKYPPTEAPNATDTVIKQCELWADNIE